MLVLTRRRNETIVIDSGRIKIVVISIHGGQVKLGIQADGMTIDREEIHERRVRNEPRPGICRICGCTELRACQLGGDAFLR